MNTFKIITFLSILLINSTINAQSNKGLVGSVNDIGIASQSIPSLTATSGIYSNRIPKASSVSNVAEVCFKDGETKYDSNDNNDLVSGECQPGDVGFVIEKNATEAKKWHQAKAHCTAKGLRLPELFEWMLACDKNTKLGMNSMIGKNWEWSSNVLNLQSQSKNGYVAAVIGHGSCETGSSGWVTSSVEEPKKEKHSQGSYGFRCVK